MWMILRSWFRRFCICMYLPFWQRWWKDGGRNWHVWTHCARALRRTSWVEPRQQFQWPSRFQWPNQALTWWLWKGNYSKIARIEVDGWDNWDNYIFLLAAAPFRSYFVTSFCISSRFSRLQPYTLHSIQAERLTSRPTVDMISTRKAKRAPPQIRLHSHHILN